MLQNLINWLAATRVSGFISEHQWITPLVQSVHILGVACLMGSALMINLRLLGWAERGQSLAAVEQRYGTWLWSGALVLLFSGAILVVADPGRELHSALFMVKMALLLLVLALAWVMQRRVRAGAGLRGRTLENRTAGRVFGGVSLVLWVAIIGAGRWIAYIG